ncbi:hypothetical protein HFO05_07055 [Rhizobium laguerreae]|uniref:hypothetical protein n=1 Tax=Rhizobium laguerreae TaxID=1076926 RepID=UPI001C9157FD|nr:hypothetical protein [Rhizobium laguerreae]MBY3268369.1 hypothetical protein [Rhizobium laguerreae]
MGAAMGTPPSVELDKVTAWKAAIKEALAIFAAGPAAVGFIAELNNRFEFIKLFETIILNYTKVSQEIWKVVLSFLPFKVPFDHYFLSFMVLMVIPSVVFLVYKAYSSNVNKLHLAASPWPKITAASAAVITVLFINSFYMFATVSLYLIILGISMYPAAFLLKNIPPRALEPADFWVALGMVAAVIVVLNIVIVVILSFILPGFFAMIVNFFTFVVLIGPILLIVASAIYLGFRGPAYIVLIGLSIFAFDWLSTSVVPSVQQWLEGIGIQPQKASGAAASPRIAFSFGGTNGGMSLDYQKIYRLKL